MSKESSVELEIPLKPLSQNVAWQGRRFKTKTYKKYQSDILQIIGYAKETIKGYVHINCIFYLLNFERTDIDNLLKCLLDTIVDLGYIEDDRKVLKYTIEKRRGIKEDKMELHITNQY